MAECKFDKKDGCHANACFSNQKCGSRDEEGNPMYWVSKKELKALKEK